MAETFRHDSDGHAGGEHERRLAVPEVVQPDAAQPRGIGELVEPLGHVRRRDRVAVFAGERQAVIDVRASPRRALGLLRELLRQEDADGPLVEVDAPRFARGGFRSAKPVRAVLSPAERALDARAVDLDDLLPHNDDAAQEIDVVPPQPDELAAA